MAQKKLAGYTLIEVMITVAILGIITAIAYPSYTKYTTDARRTDGQALLLDIMAREERSFTENNTYTTTIGAGVGGLGVTNISAEGYYTVAAGVCDGGQSLTSCVKLTATPQGVQTGDAKCGAITYNSLGVKTESGTAADFTECW